MSVFCKDLVCNQSIVELSLPENGINKASLCLLLDTVKNKANMKELELRNNSIGRDCVALIKDFLTRATLDSLV